jgi:hypothetical protein
MHPFCIDVGDGDHLVAAKVSGEVFLVAPARCNEREVADDEARDIHAARFDVLGIGPYVADMRIGERDDLPRIRGIGEDLLVARHCGVEDNLSDRLAVAADAVSAKNAPVGEYQDGGGLLRHERLRSNVVLLPAVRLSMAAKKRESANHHRGSSRFHWSKIIAER